jgi:lipopolysaccharide export system protein LptA
VKKASPLKKATQKAAIVGSTIPALLTAEELTEIDQLAKASDPVITQVDAKTAEQTQQLESSVADLENQRTTLNTELVAVVSNDTKVQDQAEPLTPREDTVPVSVEAVNGMYFDSVTGTAIYQKDVVVIHPQMHLTCSDELNVFLKKAPEDPNSPPKEGEAPKFDGFEKAIATGNVVIRAKDNEGKPIITHSEIATYDGNTEIIVLKGGRPFVQQGNTIARILSDNGYIKILPNMSVRIVGKHEIKANLNELQQ